MSVRVGVIGLGAMGFPIASTVLKAGFELGAYSLPPSRIEELVEKGAGRAADAAELATFADVLIVSLPSEADVREVLFGDRGFARSAAAGKLVIDTSTISPVAARELAADLASFDVGYLDAPVSGGPLAAEAGTLSIMVGGSETDFAAAEPVLAAIGGVISHCGPVGAGQVCKACNQLIVMGTIELVAEALVLADRSGLAPKLAREALMGGYAASRILELHGQRMIERDFTPGGKARFNQKDIEIINDLAARSGLMLPAFTASAQQMLRLLAEGGGDLDNAALVTVVEGEPGR